MPLTGDTAGLIAGSERLSRNSWALVVVASVRSDKDEDFSPISILRGVEAAGKIVPEGVIWVLLLAVDDWEDWDMCPRRDCDLLVGRDAMGPPLSDTGSKEV